MFNKIYLTLLAIATTVMLFITLYGYSWLKSIGSPEIAAENYNFYSSLGWNFLWLSFLSLAIVAAVVIWKNGRSWSLWGAFVYFAVFITLQTFWLAPTFQSFLKSNNLAENSYTFDPVFGSILIIVMAIATFFTQFLLFRMRDKIVGNEDAKEIEDIQID